MRALFSDDLLTLANVLGVDAVRITYEVSGKEPLHPDPNVVTRMYEFGISDCESGCKIYADPQSNVRVLAHNSSYGCTK